MEVSLIYMFFAGGHPGDSVSPEAGEQQPPGGRREERH